jgi:site-specific DNA recombinase
LRFAFYGRVSTAEYQDPESSMGWQRDSALDLIGSVGRIVVEYFDVGCSRRLAWTDRPQAHRLLEALAQSDREFDAIVVGEAERAFCAGQLPAMTSTFVDHDVQVWLPELNGAVDPENPVHQAVVLQLGARARREVVRARFRTTAAMRAQARDQGRYLGGRPPYGYRLVDAGPHPNTAHARWGRRLQRLDPDPRTAPTVGRIFAERQSGRSVSGIARALNEAGVPCPSAADAERNSHRDGRRWTETCVATILANPRYTGHQVWNRQSTQHVPIIEDGPGGIREYGRRRVQRWNQPEDWVTSTRMSHPALVASEDFLAVQNLRAVRSEDTVRRRHIYLLAGLVRCALCGRTMDSHWVNNRPGYRCRHGHRSSRSIKDSQRGYLYVSEDELIQPLLADPLLADQAVDPQGLAGHLRQHKIIVDCGDAAST